MRSAETSRARGAWTVLISAPLSKVKRVEENERTCEEESQEKRLSVIVPFTKEEQSGRLLYDRCLCSRITG